MKNLKLVRAFKAAKKYIEIEKTHYICRALENAQSYLEISPKEAIKAKQLIEERLDGERSCEWWLLHNVSKFEYNYYVYNSDGENQMRLYRLRWLDALIAEFS